MVDTKTFDMVKTQFTIDPSLPLTVQATCPICGEVNNNFCSNGFHLPSDWVDGRPPITMVPVHSSNIAAVGYDDAAGELHVRFKVSGATDPRATTYIYPGVNKETYNIMARLTPEYQAAGSVGSFFDRHVKKVVDPKLVRKVVRP